MTFVVLPSETGIFRSRNLDNFRVWSAIFSISDRFRFGILEAPIQHGGERSQRVALCASQDVQRHTQFIMQLEPRMVALGFMAGRESAVERRRAIGPKGEGKKAEVEEKVKEKRKREREGEGRRGEPSGPNTGAIFPWNELYASRGSRCIIYRSAFHYFFVVHLRSGSGLETRSPARQWRPLARARFSSQWLFSLFFLFITLRSPSN